MARYVCSYRVTVSQEKLPPLLKKTFESCGWEVVYQIDDYCLAKETPGRVPFTKLVSIEASIDLAVATERNVSLSLVVKNDELPIRLDNYCFQRFQELQQTIAKDSQWRVVADMAS